MLFRNFCGHQQELYLDRKNYRLGKKNYLLNNYKIDQLIDKFSKIAEDGVQPMKHYREEHNNIPPWILLKGATFGNLANFTKLQKRAPKNEILSMISGLPFEIFNTDESLKKMFMDIIFLCHTFRNRAAHTGRMYNYISHKSEINYCERFHSRMKISAADYRAGKGHGDLYTLLHALSWFENDEGYFQLKFTINYGLTEHLKKYPEDKKQLLEEMHFPSDYQISDY